MKSETLDMVLNTIYNNLDIPWQKSNRKSVSVRKEELPRMLALGMVLPATACEVIPTVGSAAAVTPSC